MPKNYSASGTVTLIEVNDMGVSESVELLGEGRGSPVLVGELDEAIIRLIRSDGCASTDQSDYRTSGRRRGLDLTGFSDASH